MKRLLMIIMETMQVIIYILLFNILTTPDVTTTDIIVYVITLPIMLYITYNYMLKIVYYKKGDIVMTKEKEEAIKEQIHKIIAEQAEVGIDYIKPAQRLEEDLELDNLDIIELSIEVENIYDDDELDIKVTEDEYSNWVTVEDVVDSYLSKVNNKEG